MERKISMKDVREAMDEVYEQVKSIKDGVVDDRNVDADVDDFGVTVAFTDGTVINKGDAQKPSAMGDIAKVALATLLFEQNDPHEMLKKAGNCVAKKVEKKPHGLAVGAKGVRAFSMLQPVGDAVSKWNFYEDRLIDMMGSSPVFSDKMFEATMRNVDETQEVDALAEAGFYLYDDAAESIKLYAKARNMMATTEQLATMGATIAADGVNPVTHKVVFDGAISQYVVATMAAKGPHKMNLPWLVMAGVPGKRSFGGAILAIYPGVMAVAAYSPRLNAAGVSVRAAKMIIGMMRKLDVSLFASARVEVAHD